MRKNRRTVPKGRVQLRIECLEQRCVLDAAGSQGTPLVPPSQFASANEFKQYLIDGALERYKDLFAKNLVMPAQMELFIMKSDGTQQKQLTSNGAANFAPYFHPNGKQIIFFCSSENVL